MKSGCTYDHGCVRVAPGVIANLDISNVDNPKVSLAGPFPLDAEPARIECPNRRGRAGVATDGTFVSVTANQMVVRNVRASEPWRTLPFAGTHPYDIRACPGFVIVEAQSQERFDVKRDGGRQKAHHDHVGGEGRYPPVRVRPRAPRRRSESNDTVGRTITSTGGGAARVGRARGAARTEHAPMLEARALTLWHREVWLAVSSFLALCSSALRPPWPVWIPLKFFRARVRGEHRARRHRPPRRGPTPLRLRR